MKLKTTLSVAYSILKESAHPLPFSELWNEINKIQSYSGEKAVNEMTRFYTNLMFDGRFVNLGDNTWDLRERVRHEDIALELKTVYSDIDEEVEEEDEDEIDLALKTKEGDEDELDEETEEEE